MSDHELGNGVSDEAARVPIQRSVGQALDLASPSVEFYSQDLKNLLALGPFKE